MRMQCIRCLSSTFEQRGAQGCSFCAEKDTKQFLMEVSSRHGGDTLPVKRVEFKDKKK